MSTLEMWVERARFSAGTFPGDAGCLVPVVFDSMVGINTLPQTS